MSWGARLMIGLVLILIGASAATWGLAHYDKAAQVLGVTAEPANPSRLVSDASGEGQPKAITATPSPKASAAEEERIDILEQRLARVENAAQRAQGSAGRADGLVIAVAARRAIDRGVALGYLEALLVERFGRNHQRAVATIVTGARQPVRLHDLIAGFEEAGPDLRRGGSEESWWTGLRREVGSLVQVHSAKRPSLAPDARYQRALSRLQSGDVDQALAETMRMPGAVNAQPWILSARRYIAVHRALDELESAALMTPQA